MHKCMFYVKIREYTSSCDHHVSVTFALAQTKVLCYVRAAPIM